MEMPTGYTAAVVDGKITEFKDFALQCSRAFGALISMRDDPFDAPLPEKIEPSLHHDKALSEARTKLASRLEMEPEQAMQAAAEDYEKRMRSHEAYEAERVAQNNRIAIMESKVDAWVPPTPEHVEMKKFMQEQLRISVSDYVRPAPERLAGPSWLVEQIKRATHDIKYHTKEREAEIERASRRTEWLKQLRQSLGA
jgi:hypothetical protein